MRAGWRNQFGAWLTTLLVTLSAPSLATDASPPVQALARRATQDGDANGLPFAIVDKRAARIHVFAADGRPLGSAPALLGLALGDTSAPGVGERVSSGIPEAQRTTPAGRFSSQPGRNLMGEAVVWVDYQAAVAVHRLRPSPARERRPQRLVSATPADNRITLGCVVVDPVFYDRVVAPVLGRGPGVVYVLPDHGDWRDVFNDASGL